MSIGLEYEIKGINRVKNSLRKLASDYRKETDDTVEAWTKARKIQFKAFGYPAQRNAPQPFKTAKQRRWFFWALKTGQITVPYRRTGTIANSWSARKTGWSDWLLKNSAQYSQLVIGRGQQANYHKGHWWVAEDIIESNAPELTKDIENNLIGLAKP